MAPGRGRQEWTISVWTLGPIDVGDHTYRDLVGRASSNMPELRSAHW